jgi:hypothetical protein
VGTAVADCARALLHSHSHWTSAWTFSLAIARRTCCPLGGTSSSSPSLFSLSLSLSLPLFPFPFLPLLYFSFLSKRRKGLVLTFSFPPPPPPSPPLPFHHSAFGSPIPVVSPCPPCVCGFCCLRGGLLASDIADIISVTFLICLKNTVFCFCLGLIKSTPFFFFSVF